MYVRGYLQGSENGRVVTIAIPLPPTRPKTTFFPHYIPAIHHKNDFLSPIPSTPPTINEFPSPIPAIHHKNDFLSPTPLTPPTINNAPCPIPFPPPSLQINQNGSSPTKVTP